jgi:hypothetical protein
MLLGDGYELRPISEAWDLAHHYFPAIPAQCPEHGLAVYVDQGAVYACSVGLYPTPGRHLLAEYLCTNPEVRGRVRSMALRQLVFAAMTYCVAIGKQPYMLNSCPGVRALLRNMGVGGRVQGLEVLSVRWP